MSTSNVLPLLRRVAPPQRRRGCALLPVLLCALLSDTAAALPSSAPRVILMQLSDDFGWANWGYHGYTNYTPNLDALAREGVVLSRTYVFNLCSPSRCALQTGRNPVHVNAVNSPIQQHNPADPMSGQQGVPLNMTCVRLALRGCFRRPTPLNSSPPPSHRLLPRPLSVGWGAGSSRRLATQPAHTASTTSAWPTLARRLLAAATTTR